MDEKYVDIIFEGLDNGEAHELRTWAVENGLAFRQEPSK